MNCNRIICAALLLAAPLYAQIPATNLNPGIEYLIPQFVDGGGYRTVFYVTNTSTTQQESFLLMFLGDDGELLDVSLEGFGRQAAIFPSEAAPGQTKIYRTNGPIGGQTQQGYVALLIPTARHLTMYAIIESKDPDSGQWTGQASISSSKSIAGAGFMAFDNTQDTVTAIAIVNTSNKNSVDYTIRDADGNHVEQGTLPLSPAHHTAFLMPQKWASTAGKTGTIMFGTPSTTSQGTPTGAAIVGLRYRRADTGWSYTQIPISEQGPGQPTP